MFSRLASGWSPYGLEAVRRAALRVRLLKAIAALIAVYVLVTAYLVLTTKYEYVATQFGGEDQGPDRSETDAERNRPVRVTLTPGRAAFSNLQDEGGTEGIPEVRPPPAKLSVKWLGLLQLFGAYAGIYALFAKIARSGIHKQVNFGVYKGSMPYELHSQALRKKLFTHKMAKYSLPFVRQAEYYAHIAPDFASLFWKRLLEGDPLQAPVVNVIQHGRPLGKARPA